MKFSLKVTLFSKTFNNSVLVVAKKTNPDNVFFFPSTNKKGILKNQKISIPFYLQNN